METTPLEWLNLVLRWTHVIAAIFWIGHAFLFNELDAELVPPEEGDPREGLEGELYMVHGGGFYKVEKSWAFPERLRGELKWFKWESAATWTSGFFLLVVVFYLGGGVYLVDPSVADISVGLAAAVGVASLVVGWLIYDGLCRTPLVHRGALFGVVGFLAVLAAGYGYTHLLSGRAAFLHVGALLATLMAANVWLVIIPTMKTMVAEAEHGRSLDVALGRRANQRSKHNNYLVFPVIFLMISNHYPSLYGAEQAWAVMGAIVLLGAGVKHVMNRRGDGAGWKLAVVLSVVGAFGLWGWQAWREAGADVEVAEVPPEGARPIDPDTTGMVTGVVRFEGEVPAPRTVRLVNCPQQDEGVVELQDVRVADGRLADVFVWIEEGWQGWEVPEVAQGAVVEVDQRGCLYEPTVVGVRTGQTVAFLNSDPVPHNVRTVAEANPAFNEMMVGQDTRIEKRFRKPEIMVEARCDIHPWMKAHLGVVAHPWFAVTPADGTFTLEGLPPGTYVLGAWHQAFGPRSLEITVREGAATEAAFRFGP